MLFPIESKYAEPLEYSSNLDFTLPLESLAFSYMSDLEFIYIAPLDVISTCPFAYAYIPFPSESKYAHVSVNEILDRAILSLSWVI